MLDNKSALFLDFGNAIQQFQQNHVFHSKTIFFVSTGFQMSIIRYAAELFQTGCPQQKMITFYGIFSFVNFLETVGCQRQTKVD